MENEGYYSANGRLFGVLGHRTVTASLFEPSGDSRGYWVGLSQPVKKTGAIAQTAQVSRGRWLAVAEDRMASISRLKAFRRIFSDARNSNAEAIVSSVILATTLVCIAQDESEQTAIAN